MPSRTSVLLCCMVLTVVGCDYRMMDSHWNSLAKKGVSSSPGEYHSAVYTLGATDEQFAAAVPDFKKVKIRYLNFQETQLTDRSIDGLLQLRNLERLQLVRQD